MPFIIKSGNKFADKQICRQTLNIPKIIWFLTVGVKQVVGNSCGHPLNENYKSQ